MAPSWTSKIFFWGLANSITIWLGCGLAVGSEWVDSPAASTKYLGVEAVGDEIPPSQYLPVELREEQFFLLDWASNVKRPRRGFRFPPGIILGAALAAAGLFFFFKLKYETPSGKQIEQIELSELVSVAGEQNVGVAEDSGVNQDFPTSGGPRLTDIPSADQGALADNDTLAGRGPSADESHLEGAAEET
ncbi:hypothetical protein ACSSS7_002408 [Eimeria intestinalis]